MKKSIVLLITLLSLVGCASPKSNGNAKKTTYCSCYEDNPTPVLDSHGLDKTNMLDSRPYTMTSHQSLREDKDNENVLFDSYESVISFADELETKARYGNYDVTLTHLRGLKEDDFQSKNLFLTKQFSLGSSGYDLYFDAAYLKNNILYMHGFKYDSHSPGASGKSFTTDMIFVAGYVWLDKDITYSECEFVFDQDLRQPVVVELD